MVRHKYSDHELTILCNIYNETKYPSSEKLKEIATKLNLEFNQVKVSKINNYFLSKSLTKTI